MSIQVKRLSHLVPGYSLTGDLLSYMRCRMQYRYHNGSALPPSRPVQMWFGEFIHGVMEAAYRIWLEKKLPFVPPWPYTPADPLNPPPPRMPHDIAVIGERVEARLKRQGKVARSNEARDSAYRRAVVGVNRLGPHLFPLITSAEERLLGTRAIPKAVGAPPLRADRYELSGVIDVLTNVTLGVYSEDAIAQAVNAACPGLAGEYEVIVDYKGARRPPLSEPYWEQGAWQVQTYAWLRGRQPNAKPVAAGILIYINELDPGVTDLKLMQKEMARGDTDVMPTKGSADERFLRLWTPKNDTAGLSEVFRLQRALRVIPITPASVDHATKEFDKIVREIETCVAEEANAGHIGTAWLPNCKDEDTCVACDFRNFCPTPAGTKAGYVPPAPHAP